MHDKYPISMIDELMDEIYRIKVFVKSRIKESLSEVEGDQK